MPNYGQTMERNSKGPAECVCLCVCVCVSLSLSSLVLSVSLSSFFISLCHPFFRSVFLSRLFFLFSLALPLLRIDGAQLETEFPDQEPMLPASIRPGKSSSRRSGGTPAWIYASSDSPIRVGLLLRDLN